MPTAVFLSPHLDDAAFSCGGLMARLANADWHLVHATLFTATVPDPSGFALECQLEKGIGADVDYMALRRREDREFAERIEVSDVVHGPFPEAPHRGYSSPDALFGPVRDDDSVLDPLCDYLRALLREHAPDLIVSPQAIGEHVDHVQLVDAVGRVASLDACPPLVWYRDAPYTIEHPKAESPFSHVRERDSLAIDVEPVLPKKCNAATAYESQLNRQFARRFSDWNWTSGNDRPAHWPGDQYEKDAGTGTATMRRALAHHAFEEAHRARGAPDNTNRNDRPHEDIVSAAECFRGGADVMEVLDAFSIATTRP